MEDDQGVCRVCRAHVYTQLLFLLLSLLSSERSQPEAKPLDFVCVSEARKAMNKVKDLQDDLAQCSAAAVLPAPVRIPRVRVNIVTWQSKPIPERRAEILQSLRILAQDIRQTRSQSEAECALRLLTQLEHNINNYIHTLTQTGPNPRNISDASVQRISSLSLVLQHLDRLISRKLEWLINEMATECGTERES